MTKVRWSIVSNGTVAMVAALGVSCRGEVVAENTRGGAGVEVTTHALTTADIDRVLGFEATTVSDWAIIQSGPGTLSVSTTASQGSRSLAVASHGYVPVQSVALTALGSRVGSVIHYDIMLPSQLKQISPTNYGATQLYLNSTSLGLSNTYLGQVELTPLPLGQWNTLTFTPSSSVLTKLRGTYTDLQVTIVVNAPYNATQPYLLDNLRFSDSTLALVTVVDGGGHPLSGLTVTAYNGSSATSNTGVTDSTGLAKVWVPPGSYRFGVTEAGVTTYSSATNQCQVPGICVAATITAKCHSVVCTAKDQCHSVGVCDPSAGVCSNPNKADGTTCNDGNACTKSDVCTAGVCGGKAYTCSDGLACTADSCNGDGTCTFSVTAGNCLIGGACYAGGAGSPTNQCQQCTPTTSQTGWSPKTNGTACNDGNACTTNDTCAGGSCVGGSPPNCDDGNVCTNDSCNPATGCVHANNTAPCNDGNACTTNDTCAGGSCVGGPPLNCNDGNVCTDDSCNPASGCVHANNTAPCNDGNACTTNDTCAGGSCVGGPPLNCNDGNVCTDDSCNPASGCMHTNNTAPCNDGNACTQTDTCQSGTCTGGNPVVCNALDACHVAGTCNSSTGACSSPLAPDGTACTDNNACTAPDQCLAGACQSGSPVPVDDGDPCTADSCSPVLGVQHTPDTSDPNCAQWYPAGLQLKVRTPSCAANLAQQSFQVLNTGTTAVSLSDITIKFWVDDTSGSNVVPQVNSGGSTTGPDGGLHQLSNVAAQAAAFSPACGPDANHQANWEITISATDSTQLAPGQVWDDLRVAIGLANSANFSPGTSTWFSPCLTGSSYALDSHFGVYYQGKLIFSSGINAPDCRAPHGTQQLTGHITPAMAAAPLVGPVPGTTVVSLAVSLPVTVPNDGVTLPLEDFVKDVSNPNSPNYRHYKDVPGFAAKYGASPTSLEDVVKWASTQGLTVARSFPNNLLIAIRGTAAAIEQALYLNLNYYLRPDGTRFYGPDREPSEDSPAPLLYVGNLNNLFVPKPAGPPPTGSANGLYTATDLRTAYAYDSSILGPTTLTGGGGAGYLPQCVGLLGQDGFSLADMHDYWAFNGIKGSMPTITARNVDGTPGFACTTVPVYCRAKDPATQYQYPYQCGAGTDQGLCPAMPPYTHCCGVDYDANDPNAPLTECYDGCVPNSGCATTGSICPSAPNTEQNADIQMSLAMAPGANVVVYFGAGFEAPMHGMATDSPLCRQLSSSWSFGGNPSPGVQQALLEFAAQGQSFFRSSGDQAASILDAVVDNPLVTVVGATDLTTNGAGGPFSSEQAISWSAGFIANGSTPAAWDCSYPSAVPLPYYQQGVTTNGASPYYRNVPDVSIVGRNVEVISDSWYWEFHGASISSPLWAGFMALVNQQNSINGLGPVGFANPVLYAIGKTAGSATNDVYGTSFNDCKAGAVDSENCAKDSQGNCICADSNMAEYSAGAGYDLASGWGSPTYALIGQLASSSPSSNLGIAVGTDFACAIRGDGSVFCWGDDSFGEMGDNPTNLDPHLIPGPVNGLPQKTITSISAGGGHTCVVLSDRTVWCWGWASNGQLGIGTTPNWSQAVQSGFQNAVTVAGGEAHTCVLLADGSVECTGRNDSGQLGNNTTISSPSPVAVTGLAGVTAIAAGQDSSCAVVGTEGLVECWGLRVSAMAGGPTAYDLTPTAVRDALGNNFTGAAAVVFGGDHVCALMQDKSVKCWGNNGWGQIGAGTGVDSPQGFDFPTTVVESCTSNAPLSGVEELALTVEASCARMSDRSVRCWGDNRLGELGDFTGLGRSCPAPVVGVSNVKSLSAFADSFMTCSLADHGISCWGEGYHGDGSDLGIEGPVTVHFF